MQMFHQSFVKQVLHYILCKKMKQCILINLGIHLGQLMESLALRLGGDGGGHPGAAGWSGNCDEVELESVLLATLSAELIE